MFESDTANGQMTETMRLKQKTESAHILLCQVVDRLTPNRKYLRAGGMTNEKNTSSELTKMKTDSAHLLLCSMVDKITPNGNYVTSRPLPCPQEVPRRHRDAHLPRKSSLSAPTRSLIFYRPMRKDPPPSGAIDSDARKKHPTCTELDKMDDPSTSSAASRISDTRAASNDSIPRSNDASGLRYLGQRAWKEGDDSDSSETHTSMPDLKARAKPCEYHANGLQDTASQRSRCANSWCCTTSSNSSSCNSPATHNMSDSSEDTSLATKKSTPDGSFVSEGSSNVGDWSGM